MTYPDAFALKKSELNAFLYADIGTELNGSSLTMLSMLARLGQDPWAEAGRLSRLPAADALKSLIQSLGTMPLGPQAASGIGATATRLLALLPGKSSSPVAENNNWPGMPQWLPFALLGLALGLGLLTMMAKTPAPDPPPVAQAQ
jgi:hypothetical protein